MWGVEDRLAALGSRSRTRWPITLKNVSSRGRALSRVAESLAVTDPDHATRLLAEHTARFLKNENSRGRVLSRVAETLATTDPGHTTQLLTEAEHTARSITNEIDRAGALISVAKALAATSS